ncbi:MAG: RlmE family RNA methyltransferase [Rhodobacteraceae bacterium]|nr:RlmE family RNA methyltransferase [Paracoccaceae bacterium]MXZ51358.1 RlmE family RNA methyltransferase [Paracoccaceae bacterium]MYF47031.1 RlmE family RNA methyltransferase [Paracoccaceae bacterium]MYI91251.1 RlmE family RNA methyltransferase [Paracoccaceae bacterium]MYJ86269.1 RlmE family RNA methyltransferase [Paracoccaceae bacterium]
MRGKRDLHIKVKTAKGRKLSSTRWLERQLNDPFVKLAREEGFKSRAAYKLIHLDDKFRFLQPGKVILDLGSAPGGWSQVAAQRTNSENLTKNNDVGTVIALDINDMDAIPGVVFIKTDIFSFNLDKLDLPQKRVDVILSDMAAPSTGHKQTDHLRIISLCEEAFGIARECLVQGGVFVSKVLEGGAGSELQKELKANFSTVKTVKPDASRKDSSEKYIVALGYRG